MRLFKMISVPHDFSERIKHLDLFHLHPVRRLFHRKTRRHLFGVLLGVGIMTTGSYVAKHAGEIHIMGDTLGYLIHGIGTVPILRHVEPLWTILTQ